MSGTPYVIGLDISLTATGISNGVGYSYTVAKAKLDARLENIFGAVSATASRFPNTVAVIEDLPTNAMGAGKTGQAVGVAKLALFRAGVPYVTVVPSTLKKWVTGNGRASKEDMIAAVDPELIQRGMFENPFDDNQVDAHFLRNLGVAYLEGQSVPGVVNFEPWSFKL